jgi:Protein of unknown function (DUF3800)
MESEDRGSNAMELVYFDESGNSGNNLNDTEQPIFVLGALIVPEKCWQKLETDLERALTHHFPEIAGAGTEIHAGDLRGSRGVFKNVPVVQRVGLRDAWLEVAHRHKLKFVYRSIEKKSYQKWLHATFGVGVVINPHIAAFALVALVVNEYLKAKHTLGIFISDENKEIVRDVEKSIRQLRLSAGPLRLSQIVEKGFFIDSTKSRILQLCDVCVLHARKKEEERAGMPSKAFDVEGIKLIEPLAHRGNERIWDVLEWLKRQQAAAETDSK